MSNNWGFHNHGFPTSEENNYMVMGRNGSRFSTPKEHQLMGYIPRPTNLPPSLPRRAAAMSSYVPPQKETQQVNKLLKQINAISNTKNDPRLAARDPRLGSLNYLVKPIKLKPNKITNTKRRTKRKTPSPNRSKINIVIHEPNSTPNKSGVLKNRRKSKKHHKSKSNQKKTQKSEGKKNR